MFQPRYALLLFCVSLAGACTPVTQDLSCASDDDCVGDDVCVLGACAPAGSKPPVTTCEDDSDDDGDAFGVTDPCEGPDLCLNLSTDAAGNGDDDGDGFGVACDNCPDKKNQLQQNQDADAWGDSCDNCRLVANDDQANHDDDDDGDACDDDDDDDGLPDATELALGTEPWSADTDGDGDEDLAEVGGNVNDPKDADDDGLIDAIESDTVDFDDDGHDAEHDDDDDDDGVDDGDDACLNVTGTESNGC